jgi:hypothetical protein
MSKIKQLLQDTRDEEVQNKYIDDDFLFNLWNGSHKERQRQLVSSKTLDAKVILTDLFDSFSTIYGQTKTI